MNEKKPYVIARQRAMGELEEEVNELIAQGYFPLGGLLISHNRICHQVMVLEDLFDRMPRTGDK